MKQKILLFCANPVNGGTARMFAELVKGLERYEEDFEIVPCINANNDVKIYGTLNNLTRLPIRAQCEIFYNEKNYNNYLYKLYRKMKRLIIYAPIKKQNISCIRKFLKEQQFDKVMVHNGGYHGDDLCDQVLDASMREQIKDRITVFHNDFQKNLLQRILYIPYDKYLMKVTTSMITVSEFTRNRILESSKLNCSIDVIYNGLTEMHTVSSNDKAKALRIEDRDEIILGMVGNFAAIKGHIYFLKLLSRLLERTDIGFHAVIIGNILDNDYYNECQEFVCNAQMQEHVTIIQGLYNAGEYTECFDIMVVPSIADESFGLVALEGMVNSVPVIAFECCGLPEVVKDKETGFIVPCKDVEALADASVRLLKDEALRRKMGSAGRQRYINLFSTDVMVRNYADYIQ